jgi:glycosyltransferase involved in cell wall biosynthesis
MRIAVLAHGLRKGGGVSVGMNFISAFRRVGREHEYFVSIPGGIGYEDVCAGLPRKEISVYLGAGNPVRRAWYEMINLPSLLKQFNPDLVLGLGNLAAKRIDSPQVLLLHNPYYVYPKIHFGRTIQAGVLLQVAAQRRQFSQDLKKIDFLFCQTKTMANRVRETYGYEGAIRIIPNAVSHAIKTEKCESHSFPAKMKHIKLKKRLLYLTSYYSHKNLEVLIDIFRTRPTQLKNYAVVITISPEQGKGAKRFLAEIKKYNLEDAIVNIGPLEQSELAEIFQNCDSLFMPTLLESFSGTYLEAMHFGIPIITSDYDFVREVCGNAALYFDPSDLDSMLEAIERVEENRKELVLCGKERLQQMFVNWDSVASNVLDVIDASLASKVDGGRGR